MTPDDQSLGFWSALAGLIFVTLLLIGWLLLRDTPTHTHCPDCDEQLQRSYGRLVCRVCGFRESNPVMK